MAITSTQTHRIAKFSSPLGQDVLLFAAIEGREAMNQCFEFRIEVFNESRDVLDFDPAIGQHCTLEMQSYNDQVRFYDGILTEVRWKTTHKNGHSYTLILRPWLWLLSKRSNALIFHEKKAPEIIEAIFGAHGGLADFQNKLSKTYPQLEYVAQYGESDMDFVCRLMEEHGIGFYFKHAKDAHTLIMTDSLPAYSSMGSRPFIAVDGRYRRENEHFSLWRPDRQFTSGSTALVDYDFKKPSANMLSTQTGDAGYAHGQLETFQYPGRYVEQSAGSSVYAQAQIDSHRAKDKRVHAEGDCATLFPGALVTLTEHPSAAQNTQYLVIAATHSFTGEAYGSGQGDASTYSGTYELMPADRPYAPPAHAPRPRIYGPQTAKVVGSGEIDCDEHGRILVRFHWDRKSDQSRRVRVAQVWAGKEWGGVFTPRVGMEVLVNFLEGDPDQPLVVGCVYNGENKPPYALPGKKNLAGWMSNSSPGGGGYNEFVMDDTKGNELVRLHAQYDMEAKIEHDERREVGNDRTTTIKHNETLTVTNEIEISAGTKITIKCGSSKITMEPTSISIEAMDISIHAKTSLSTKSDLTATHEAGPNMTIKAMTVMIN